MLNPFRLAPGHRDVHENTSSRNWFGLVTGTLADNPDSAKKIGSLLRISKHFGAFLVHNEFEDVNFIIYFHVL